MHSSIIYSNVAKLGMGRGGDYDYFYVKIEETFVWLCQNKGLRTCFWGGIVLPLLHHLLNGLPSNSKHLHALWRYVVHNNCGANIRGKSHHAVETMADKTCLQSSNAKSISDSKPKRLRSGWVVPEQQPIPSKQPTFSSNFVECSYISCSGWAASRKQKQYHALPIGSFEVCR